jgi:hypothetical protein
VSFPHSPISMKLWKFSELHTRAEGDVFRRGIWALLPPFTEFDQKRQTKVSIVFVNAHVYAAVRALCAPRALYYLSPLLHI